VTNLALMGWGCYRGIEDKVFTMTVDNARANDVTIRILKDDFLLRDVLLIEG
jgi:hypothetical protein